MLHKQMITLIQLLPNICSFKIQTEQQNIFMRSIQTEWEWIGRQLDFYTAVQLGTRPSEPLACFYAPIYKGASKEIIEIVKQDIRLRSNYLFAFFQVVNTFWEVIKNQAKEENRIFNFLDPRTFFVQVCREIAQSQVADALNNDPNTVSGAKLSQTQSAVSLLDKFLRGKHPNQEEIAKNLLHSECWGDFALAAIRSGTEERYLTTNDNWKMLLKAQKAQKRLTKEKRVTLLWNQGIPVNSKNCKGFF